MAKASVIPYMAAHGSITKALQKIETASVPDRFTQDFLATKLDMAGGTPRPVIPFLKRMGFLASDGSPTDRYRRFRNPSHRGVAAAEGLKQAYAPLYEINEYAHDLKEKDLRGLIVQATGLESDSVAVRAMLGSFKAVRAFANFEASTDTDTEESGDDLTGGDRFASPSVPSDNLSAGNGIRLGYTINLNLPPTADIAVFNAIFKSLREHLLS